MWLSGKLDVSPSRKYKSFTFTSPDDSDWFMDVPEHPTSPVRFNTQALKRCTFEYYKLIVLHECFHLFTQDIPNKLDAKRVKDDFGDVAMVMFDVEADYYVSIFYKEVLGCSLVKYLCILYDGSTVFKDRQIRTQKFERFIGSMLSTGRPHLNQCQNDRRIYIVTTAPIVTEKSLHLIVARDTHFQQIQINVSKDCLEKLLETYNSPSKIEKQDYVRRIIVFCSEALTIPISNSISNELENLNG